MKYLLILLFLFSTHSFSGEADGKQIVCDWDYHAYYHKTTDTKVGYRFRNGHVLRIYISKNPNRGGFYEIKGFVPQKSYWIDYTSDGNYIRWSNITLNRKTLIASYIWSNREYNGKCEILSMPEMINTFIDRVDELNEVLNKAREGNKI